MLPVNENEWMNNVHVKSSKSDVDPVDLKIYHWTRGWNLRNVDKSNAGLVPPTAWFCSNGFELKWKCEDFRQGGIGWHLCMPVDPDRPFGLCQLNFMGSGC